MTPSVIAEANAAYWNVDFDSLVESAAAQISQLLIKRYGIKSGFNFVCGFGHKGAIGMAVARNLITAGVTGPVGVYLIGRPQQFKRAAAKQQWDKLQRVISSNLEVKADAYAPDIPNNDVTVECLVGTGFHGKPLKRFRDVITRVAHFKKTLVAIDQPFPGYSWDDNISIQYPKTADAQVVTVPLPSVVDEYVGPGEVAALFQPRRHTYKSDNGRLVVLAAHGNFNWEAVAKICQSYAVDAQAYVADGTKAPHMRDIAAENLEDSLTKSQAILILGDFGQALPTRALLDYICQNFPQLKFVWDSSAATYTAKPAGSMVITDRVQLKQLFPKTRTLEAALGQVKRYVAETGDYLVIHGSQDLIYGMNPFSKQIEQKKNRPETIKEDQVLQIAAQVAAYATKNEAWLAVSAGVFTASH